MKICAAQTRPIKGDIQGNIASHKTLINLAIANEGDVVVFPFYQRHGFAPLPT